MTPNQRFQSWVAAAAGTFAAGVANALLDGWLSFGVTLLQLAGLTWILWLLVTTPVDAIKLKRWVSAVVVITGFMVLFALRLVPFEFLSEAPTEFRRAALQIVTLALWVGVLVMGPAVFFAAARFRRKWGTIIGKPSAWWVVAVAWHPLWSSGSTEAGIGLGAFPIAELAFAGMSTLSFLTVMLGRLAPERPLRMWLAWAGAVLCTLLHASLVAMYPL